MQGEAVAERPLGRPRDARADRAILDATLELIAEIGVQEFRTEDVADRAKVGRARSTAVPVERRTGYGGGRRTRERGDRDPADGLDPRRPARADARGSRSLLRFACGAADAESRRRHGPEAGASAPSASNSLPAAGRRSPPCSSAVSSGASRPPTSTSSSRSTCSGVRSSIAC